MKPRYSKIIIILLISHCFISIPSYANNTETFEANLYPMNCDINYEYSHEYHVPPNELLSIGTYIWRLWVETDEYNQAEPNKYSRVTETVIVEVNEMIKKTFAMSGNEAFYNLKVLSSNISCNEISKAAE